MTDMFRVEGDDWLESHLFDRRVVVIRGDLDAEVATRVAAKLMTLDATSDEAVQLQVDSGGGELEAGFAVVDVIDAMRAPVEAVCMGRIEGTALAAVAVCNKRTTLTHAQFRLSDPDIEVSGRASELDGLMAHHRRSLDRFHERLAGATGRSAADVESDCRDKKWLSAQAAVEYGLVDRIVDRRVALQSLKRS
jgi:ATP-dependent Clp protease protease subunit